MAIQIDDNGFVVAVVAVIPDVHPDFVASFLDIAGSVGDFIEGGANVGAPPSQFHSWDGSQWVEDTAAAQENADALQAQQDQQTALEGLATLGGSSKLIFAAYNSTNSASFTTGTGVCNFNVETYNSEGVVLSGGVVSLPIVADAVYKVAYEGTVIMTSSNSRSRVTEKIQLDTGSGFQDRAGTTKQTYHREINEGSDCFSTTAIVDAGANTTLDVRLVASRTSGTGSAFSFLGDACQIEVWRVA